MDTPKQVTPENFEAQFSLSIGTVNLIIQGLRELPAKDTMDLILHLKSSTESQFQKAMEAQAAKAPEGSKVDQETQPNGEKENA